MSRVLTTQVGEHGILVVPLEEGDAKKLVRVTVEFLGEPVAAAKPMDRDGWLRFIERTAGSISDPTFERQPQGDYEERESMP